MKKLISVLVAMAAVLPSTTASNFFAPCYNGDSASFDMEFSLPAGFNAVDKDSVNEIFIINSTYLPETYVSDTDRVIALHPVVLESDAADCTLLYPIVSYLLVEMGGAPELEMKAAANSDTIDTSKIKSVKLPDMSSYANADSAVIYEMELPEPYAGKYSHCIGVYLRKYAHPALMMKVVMTDEGLANRDRYLAALLNSVRYGDKTPEEGILREKQACEMRNHAPCRHIKTRHTH